MNAEPNSMYNSGVLEVQIKAGESLLKVKETINKLEELMRVPNPTLESLDAIKRATHLASMELSDIYFWASMEKGRITK